MVEEGKTSNSVLNSRLTTVGLILVALIVLSQAVQGWVTWQQQSGRVANAFAEKGQLCSVTLTNGQIYYGRFVAANATYLQLQEVYYVQSRVDPATNEVSNALVARRKADWHAPQWMAISLDNVMLIESVGLDSRLAQLIAQDHKMHQL